MSDPIPETGFTYPNKMGRIVLSAMEDAMGRSSLNALLAKMGMEAYIDNYPPDNLEREFDFAHLANLTKGLYETYGPRGGRSFALSGGRAILDRGLKNFGALAGLNDLAFRILPLQTKLKIGLPALARIFSQFSDQKSRVEDKGNYYLYTIDCCSMCWGQTSGEPICHLATGLLQESLHWVSGGMEFEVEEIGCVAIGDEACIFRVSKEPLP